MSRQNVARPGNPSLKNTGQGTARSAVGRGNPTLQPGTLDRVENTGLERHGTCLARRKRSATPAPNWSFWRRRKMSTTGGFLGGRHTCCTFCYIGCFVSSESRDPLRVWQYAQLDAPRTAASSLVAYQLLGNGHSCRRTVSVFLNEDARR